MNLAGLRIQEAHYVRTWYVAPTKESGNLRRNYDEPHQHK
jgi:hypothetical protein